MKKRDRLNNFVRLLAALVIAAGGFGLWPSSQPESRDSSSLLVSTAYADVLATDLIGGKPQGMYPIDDPPDIAAPSALVATADGLILWERNGTLPLPMASTTKMMTAIIALENSQLQHECLVTMGAANTIGTSASLKQGDVTTMHTLLIGLMLPSGNDAAVAIAENIAGTEFDFVVMMNQKAVELGMLNTNYVDASGLDEDNLYSTVEDYLILARYAMRNEVFRQLVAMREATVIINGREIVWKTTNRLFEMMEGVIGVKTGTNIEADACLVSAVVYNGITFYCVVFGSPTDYSRYTDTITLLNWAFKHYRTVDLISSTDKVADLALLSWIDKTVGVRVPLPITINIFDLAGPIKQEVELEDWQGSIIRGQRVGRIIWSQNGEVLATSELVADTTVAEPGFWKSFTISWDRFWGGFSGKPKHASTQLHLPDILLLP
ncbi:MAG: D-alanyl-D-alanine carboxypeptidase [Coriobacteriales bacterium]|jgi:D-alanyl-D-alanine carboxypeptidase (penicillin-binding protein 5/6)|nr:D-alanyl-D-alanine carboxypeptidase [Coriobacteriales bacterium]